MGYVNDMRLTSWGTIISPFAALWTPWNDMHVFFVLSLVLLIWWRGMKSIFYLFKLKIKVVKGMNCLLFSHLCLSAHPQLNGNLFAFDCYNLDSLIKQSYLLSLISVSNGTQFQSKAHLLPLFGTLDYSLTRNAFP